MDEVIRTDGRHVRAEEEPLLGLAFLLPEDGYSCDIVRGVPAGLVEFLAPLAPLCRLTPNPSAAGYWTIFFHDPMRSPSAMSGRSFATAFTNPPPPNQLTSPQQPPSSAQLGHQGSMHPMPGNAYPGGVNNSVTTPTAGTNVMMNSVTSLNSPGQFNHHHQNGTTTNGPVNRASGISMGPEPEIQTIKLQKLNSGLGLSIVAAKVRKIELK